MRWRYVLHRCKGHNARPRQRFYNGLFFGLIHNTKVLLSNKHNNTTHKIYIIMKATYTTPATKATRHNGKVNHFAKIRQPHGKGFIFGFIDIATAHGLGFIYSVGDMWGGKILHASDEATLCTTPADLAKAKASAKTYFENEEVDLKAHLARCQRTKEKARIVGLIETLAQIRRNAGV